MRKRASLLFAFSYVAQHKMRLLAAILWRIAHELVPMQIPIFTGAIIDGLTQKRGLLYGIDWFSTSPVTVIQVSVAGLFGIAFMHGLCSFMRTVTTAKLSMKFVVELRKNLFEKMTILSLDQHQRYGSGELLDRSLRDTEATLLFVERVFVQTFTTVVRAGYPTCMLFVINPILALIALSVLAPQWFLSRYLEGKLHAAMQKSRESDSELITAVKENLDGIETIKALNAEATSVAKLRKKAEKLELDQLHANKLTALMSCLVWLMTSIGLALTWWQGGMYVLAGKMTPGTLVVFSGFVVFAYQPFRQFTNIVKAYRRGIVSLERIHDLLDTPISVQNSRDAQSLHVTEGYIEFKNVTFSYNKMSPVLHDINLKFDPRQFIAVVGRSGCGKSSLLRLIARLYNPDNGMILIDGQVISHVTLESLRSQIAIVPQKPVLFNTTIYDNIVLARPHSTANEVEEACRAACAMEFIERLAKGFETYVGPGGVNLSGGEIQRIAIARALLFQPKILIMDEPTSALDSESEAKIIQTLLRLRHTMTIILAAHRPNTVRYADRCILMERGRVIADGTHEALLGQSDEYRNLFMEKIFAVA